MVATRLIPLRLRGVTSVGLRGAPGVTPDAQTFLLQNEVATVVLNTSRAARQDTVSVSGLVMPHRTETAALRGAVAHLLSVPGNGIRGAAHSEGVDERGGFVIGGVAPGTYRLELRWAGGVAVTEGMQIGPAQSPPGTDPP
jgi:hypothetical protein